MELELYYIPHLSPQSDKTLFFKKAASRDIFFNNWAAKQSYQYDKKIKSINDLEFITTIPSGGYNYQQIYNYARITTTNAETFLRASKYYYIIDRKQNSFGAVELTLRYDVIMNHFYAEDNFTGVDTIARSVVHRMHKNRFNGLIPIYDAVREPLTINDNDVTLVDTIKPSNNRVRIAVRPYGASALGNPVKRIYTETSFSKAFAAQTFTSKGYKNIAVGGFGNKDNITSGEYQIRYNDGVWSSYYNTPAGSYHVFYVTTLTSPFRYVIRCVTVNNSTLATDGVGTVVIDTGSENFNWDLFEIRVRNGKVVNNLRFNSTVALEREPIENGKTLGYGLATGVIKVANSFDDIDYRDTLNSKIVELSFLDLDDVSANVKYNFDENFMYFDMTDRLEVATTMTLPTNVFDTSKVNKVRVPFNEPKLFNSQFRPIFANILGHSLSIEVERLKNSLLTWLPINATYATNMNSMKMIIDKDNNNYRKSKPADLVENINLVNTVTQFVNEADTYQQYMQAMDLKQIEIQRNANQRNALIAGIQQGTGILGGLTAGGTSMSPAQVGSRIGSAFMSVGSIVADAIDSQRVADISYRQKLQQLQLSTINLAGSDVDLNSMDDTDYLKVYTVQPVSVERKMLDDYFYYYGYACNEMKTITEQNVRTRKYFNYIQMTPYLLEFNDLSDDLANEMASRFERGITFIHVQTSGVSTNQFVDITTGTVTSDMLNVADYLQIMENWEVE